MLLPSRAASKPSGLCWVDHACPGVHARCCLLLMLPQLCSCAGRCTLQAALCQACCSSLTAGTLWSSCWHVCAGPMHAPTHGPSRRHCIPLSNIPHPATLSVMAMCTFWSPLPAGAAMRLVQLARADGMKILAKSVISLVNPRWQGSLQPSKDKLCRTDCGLDGSGEGLVALESRQGAAAGRGLSVHLYQQPKRSWH